MPSFDIVSKTDVHEVDNALAGVLREVAQRFDFKGAKCTVTRTDDALTIEADDDLKLKQMHELLKTHMVRRKLDTGALDFQKVEKASGNAVRQVVRIKQGIDRELARDIIKAIKDAKLKVQAAIQGDELRVSAKNRDDLQECIRLVRGLQLEQPLQYLNFRD
jgi:cyclic-di-GMP-binding protein